MTTIVDSQLIMLNVNCRSHLQSVMNDEGARIKTRNKNKINVKVRISSARCTINTLADISKYVRIVKILNTELDENNSYDIVVRY